MPELRRINDLTVQVERPPAPTTKPPIVLVHGFGGGAWFWENYQPMLARHGYESHAINLRGHHGSRPVKDIGKVSVHDYVQDALDVARSLGGGGGGGGGRPIVIGHSMGGLIAQKVAEAGACRAAVFISSAPPRWIPIVSWRLLRRQLKYARQLFFFEPILPDRSDADDLMFNRTPLPDRDVQFARLVPESGRAGFDLSFGTVAVRESRVTAPTLVVTGTDDHFIAPRVSRALARKYGSPLREYDSFGHHIITEPGWERPCSDIIQWMDQNARG